MKNSAMAVAVAAISLVGIATPSAAAVSLSAYTVTGPFAHASPTYTFSPGSTPSYSGGMITTGSLSGVSAAPVGGSGEYFTVGGTGAPSPALITLSGFGAIGSISLLLGSVDSYNTISFGNVVDGMFQALSSYTGTQIYTAANGNQGISSYATFTFTGADQLFNALQITSTSPAAELDDLTINSAVPEPGTWAMMLLGFAGIGYSMRRRPANRRRLQAV